MPRTLLSGSAARIHLTGIALLACVLTGTAAFAQDAEVAVADQRIESGNIVKVEKANIPSDGFVVIHATDTAAPDAPGAPIGYALLSRGSNANVSVKLEQPVAPGQKLVAVLHEDTTKTGMFDPDTTKPVAKPDGHAVMAEFVAK